MNKTPAKTRDSHSWVQTERQAHEAWAALMYESPTAARLMHLLVARAGENNAVVASLPTLANLLKVKSRQTVITAVNALKAGNWVQVLQTGGTGTTNVYVINDRVAWHGSRDGLKYSLFSATVIVSSAEQPKDFETSNQAPLRRLPRIGEMQLPHGDGLPPPSQPFLPDMEPDLPVILDQKE